MIAADHPERRRPSKKLIIVRRLLENDTYMVDSGVYQIAEKALMSLSLEALHALELISDMRRVEKTS